MIDDLKAKGASELFFSNGEPTLDESLLDFLQYGKSLGFKTKLETNGIRLSDRAFAEQIKDLGVYSIRMNTPSYKKEIYEEITQIPGSFNLFEKALENISELGFKFESNVAITNVNYDYQHFIGLINFFEGKGLEVNAVSLRVFRMNSGNPIERKYMPVYELIGPELEKMVKYCREKEIWVEAIPPFSLPLCTCEGVEDVFADPTGHPWHAMSELFSKPEGCKNCAANKFCVGISSFYPHKFIPKPFKEVPKNIMKKG